MGTPVIMTNEQLKELIERMAKMFQTKGEDESTSSRQVVPKQDQTPLIKIELPPNDIKLEGTKNYLSWSRRAKLLLQTRGLQRFVEMENLEPVDKKSTEWETWSATNSLVIAWLLSSISPMISGMVESMTRAIDVWKALARMYSGAGSVMMMVEIEEKIDAARQGERTVQEYAAELQRLWADLDHYDPLSLEGAENAVRGK